MLIRTIQLNNFLSFGATSPAIPLGPLNVIIGPNGSGKSNLLESIELLRSAPEQLLKPIREGGGVRDWLWKGAPGTPTASLDVLIWMPPFVQADWRSWYPLIKCCLISGLFSAGLILLTLMKSAERVLI